MRFRHILEEEMQGKGNIGKPTTPGVSAAEMQRILDELPREVIAPAINELADQLEHDQAAALLGAQVPGETGELPTNTPHTVQGVFASLMEYMRQHIHSRNNPHAVTAQQVGAYTKKETEQLVVDRVVEIGASDMTKAEYGGSGPGVVKKADNADQLGNRPPSYYAAAENGQNFTARLRLDGWQRSGDHWTQTAACEGVRASDFTSPIWAYKTGVQETDQRLQDALNLLNEGRMETLDGQVRATLYGDKPACDVEILFQRRVLGAGGGVPGPDLVEFASSQEVQQMLDEAFGKEGNR